MLLFLITRINKRLESVNLNGALSCLEYAIDVETECVGGLCFLLFQANLLLLWYMNYERFVENNG